MQSSENWLPAVGFEARYEVSDLGRVRAVFHRPQQGSPPRLLLGTRSTSGGHHQVALARGDGTSRSVLVHVLVLNAFVGPAPDGMGCRHLDGDPLNNLLSNLRWGTQAENIEDRARHGRTVRGERMYSARLSEDDVRIEVDPLRL